LAFDPLDPKNTVRPRTAWGHGARGTQGVDPRGAAAHTNIGSHEVIPAPRASRRTLTLACVANGLLAGPREGTRRPRRRSRAADMATYKAELPEGQALPPGFSVNTDDPRYRALHDLAVRENLSQRAFSAILGVEAQRVTGEYERARRAAAPAPAPAPAKVDMSKMSTHERFAHALNRSVVNRRG
jgi:hypothetical protein